MSRFLLGFVGVVFGLFGVAYVIAPQGLAAAAGVSANAAGLTDLRATYGGFQIGFGLFAFWSCLRPERYAPALLATAAVTGAVGAARLYGLAVDQAPIMFHYIALCLEIPIFLCAGWLYRRGHTAYIVRG